MAIIVNPDNNIPPGGKATIKHTDPGTLQITIISDDGDEEVISVGPNETVTWEPPPGWQSATFKADGHAAEFRTIAEEAAA